MPLQRQVELLQRQVDVGLTQLRADNAATRTEIIGLIDRRIAELRSEIAAAEARAGDVLDTNRADALARLEDLKRKIDSYRDGSNMRQDLGLLVTTILTIIASTGLPAFWQDVIMKALVGAVPTMHATCSAAAAIAP